MQLSHTRHMESLPATLCASFPVDNPQRRSDTVCHTKKLILRDVANLSLGRRSAGRPRENSADEWERAHFSRHEMQTSISFCFDVHLASWIETMRVTAWRFAAVQCFQSAWFEAPKPAKVNGWDLIRFGASAFCLRCLTDNWTSRGRSRIADAARDEV